MGGCRDRGAPCRGHTAARLRPVFLVATALLATIARSATAGYPESFRAGIIAIDKKDWARAAQALEQAIDLQPRETGKNLRIYGMRFERYLPYYYLGLAHYRMRDCDKALQAFETARDHGALGGILRGRVEIYSDVCRQRLGRPLVVSQPAGPSRSGVSSSPAAPGSSRVATATSPSGGGDPPRAKPNPSTPPAPPSGSSPLNASTQPSGIGTGEVRQQQLSKVSREAEELLRRGRELAAKLEQRRHAGATAFRRDPDLAEELAAANRLLSSASFRLEGSRREGDLDGVERARDQAEAACQVLKELQAAVGR
jgi:tetratricopeptide (TPR) repeat protein